MTGTERKRLAIGCVDLYAGYSGVAVVKGVSLEVESGLMGIVGRNGVGKSTLLKALAGLLPPLGGRVEFNGTPDDAMARARGGMGYMPQEQIVFDSLTVRENLLLAGCDDSLSSAAPYFEAFPRLAERLAVKAGMLSGGEKKMLSFVRTMVEPGKRLLLLDEPTEGVQHSNAEKMASFIVEAKKEKSLVVAEQNLWFLESCADDFIVIDRGEIVLRRTKEDFSMEEMEETLAL